MEQFFLLILFGDSPCYVVIFDTLPHKFPLALAKLLQPDTKFFFHSLVEIHVEKGSELSTALLYPVYSFFLVHKLQDMELILIFKIGDGSLFGRNHVLSKR